jgi:hypothetical protein
MDTSHGKKGARHRNGFTGGCTTSPRQFRGRIQKGDYRRWRPPTVHDIDTGTPRTTTRHDLSRRPSPLPDASQPSVLHPTRSPRRRIPHTSHKLIPDTSGPRADTPTRSAGKKQRRRSQPSRNRNRITGDAS